MLEHTGLEVSSLYISQVKWKYRLDVGQNYNLSKKGNSKVPKCPPQKGSGNQRCFGAFGDDLNAKTIGI